MQGSMRLNRLFLALIACLLGLSAPVHPAHAAPADAPAPASPNAAPSQAAPAAPAPSDQTPQPPVASDVAPAPSLFHHVDVGPADDRDWAGAGDNTDEEEDEDDAGMDARFDSASPLPPSDAAPHKGSRRGHRRAHGKHAQSPEAQDAEQDADGEPKVAWVIEDRKAAHRAQLLSFGMGAWPTTLSTQLLYAVPLLRRGLISPLNDAFHLEFGSLLTWGRGDTVSLWPTAGVRWDFYLTRRWATYFDLKFAVEIQLNNDQIVRPNAIVGFGGFLRLAERLLLRLELNYPQGLTVGLAVPIGGP